MDKSSATVSGCLYVVATPIGNRDDISLRAINTLKAVDVIIAEDTRHSRPLLNNLGIQKPLRSLHLHNEHEKTDDIIQALLEGKTFALISDAGTPLISDPGFPLIRQARDKGISVIPIPGACALIAALCASGVPCERFFFAGFLPAKTHARQEELKALKAMEHTVVIYESTHRIQDCLMDIQAIYGHAYSFVVAKELSKKFEHFIHASSEEILGWLLADKAHANGEFVFILPPCKSQSQHEAEHILQVLLAELPLKQAVRIASCLTKIAKNELYTLALSLQKNR